MIKTLLPCLFLIMLIACSNSSELKPFKSDGCSMFPDKALIGQQDWCECCYVHDIAYWQGGSKQQRLEADLQLKQCVFNKTNNKHLAELMYQGVRAGGSPYFPTWYRWAYGWQDQRKYQVLTETEKQQVKQVLQQLPISYLHNVCKAL